MDYDLAIIGCGPAGMSAAIYASRFGMKTAIFESKLYGGTMNLAHLIENYPGYASISGMELAEKMHEQVKKAGTQIIEEGVVEIKKINDNFSITTDRKGNHTAKAVIISTGGQHKKLGVEGEDEFLGKGVSYCATCDGPLFKGKDIAVIGGGQTAIYSALYLAEITNKVYLIHRENEFKADAVSLNKLKEKRNVQILAGYNANKIIGNDLVTGLKIEEVKSKSAKEISVGGVFICVGEIPLVALAQSIGVKLNENGSISIDQNTATNMPGVFAAGDVTGRIRQIVTATGDGAVAAINALRYVQSLKTKK